MSSILPKVYGFVGLGLMGGSFAKAIRSVSGNTEGQWLRSDAILALDSDKATLKDALERGIIDEAFEAKDAPAMLGRCDFVFIALYPQQAASFLQTYRDDFKSGAIITDISGVKSPVMDSVRKNLRPDVDFICGHPMAGSEKEGFTHADSAIFKGRNYILMPMPENKRENLDFFKDLMWKLGFSRITETNTETHDYKIGFTSQLCHVIAASLVESAPDSEITAFGGGSFEDLTRIAMINAPLWTELFLENKKNLLEHIGSFEASLEKIKKYIETEDAEKLSASLVEIRKKRIAMTRKEAGTK
jgi:prephenate dehydrogenase